MAVRSSLSQTPPGEGFNCLYLPKVHRDDSGHRKVSLQKHGDGSLPASFMFGMWRRQAEGCSSKCDVRLSEYLATWRSSSAVSAEDSTPGVRSLACAQPACSQPGTGGTDSGGDTGARTADTGALLYLKDWHFAAEHPDYQVLITTKQSAF